MEQVLSIMMAVVAIVFILFGSILNQMSKNPHEMRLRHREVELYTKICVICFALMFILALWIWVLNVL